MTKTVVPLALASSLSLMWLPIFIRFVRAWRTRSNPVSLAICTLVAFAIYVPTYIAVMFPPSWPLATVLMIDAIACATFYISIWYSNHKFSDTRKN